MRLLILLLVVVICLVSAKYLPDDPNNLKQLLSRNKRSDSEESITAEDENNSEDDDDDSPDQNEAKERSKLLAKIEKMRQKLLEKQEKERQKQEETQRKLEEKMAKELRKEEEKRLKEERKRKEKLEKERKRLEEEQRKIQQKLLENERKRQEKIQKQLDENISKIQENDINSSESNDSLELKDFWKKHIYTKYGITEANTNIEKKAAFNRYIQEELGLNSNSTASERRQAVLSLIQNKLQTASEQNTLRNELIKYINVVGVQKIRTNLEKEIEELNNKTKILNNVNLPWVLTAKQNVAEQLSFLQTIGKYLSNVLPNWFNGNESVSVPQVDTASNINKKSSINVSSITGNTKLSSDVIDQNTNAGGVANGKPSTVSAFVKESQNKIFGTEASGSQSSVNTVPNNSKVVSVDSNSLQSRVSKGISSPVSLNVHSGSTTAQTDMSQKSVGSITNFIVSPLSTVDGLPSSLRSSINTQEITDVSNSAVTEQGVFKETAPVTEAASTTIADTLSVVSETMPNNNASPPSTVDALSPSKNKQIVTVNTGAAVNKQETVITETMEPAVVVDSLSSADFVPAVSETVSNKIALPVATVNVVSSSLTHDTNTQVITASTKAVVNKEENIGKGSTVPATVTAYTTTADVLSVVSETIPKNTALPPSSVDTLSSSANTQEVTATTKAVVDKLESIGKETTAPLTVTSSTSTADVLPIVAETISNNNPISPSTVDALSSSLTHSTNTKAITASNKAVVDKHESVGKGSTVPGTVTASKATADVLSVVSETISKNTASPSSSVGTSSSSLTSSTNTQQVKASTKVVVDKLESIGKETIAPVTAASSPTIASVLPVVAETISNKTKTSSLNVDPLSSSLTLSTNTQEITTSTKAVISKQESVGKGSTVPATVTASTTTADVLSVVSETTSKNTASPASSVDASSPSSTSSTNIQQITESSTAAVSKQETLVTETTKPTIVVDSTSAADLLPVVSENVLNNISLPASTVNSFSSSVTPSTNTQAITENTETVVNKQESIGKGSTVPATVTASTTTADVLPVISETILKNIASPSSSVDTLQSSTNTQELTATTKIVDNKLVQTVSLGEVSTVPATTTADVLSVVNETISKNTASPPSSSKVVDNKLVSIGKGSTVPVTVMSSTTAAGVLSDVSETISNYTTSSPSSVDASSSSLISSANTQELTATTKVGVDKLESIGKETTAPVTVASSTTTADVLPVAAETISNNTPISPSTVDALSSSLTPSTNTKAIMASTKAVVNKQESISKGSAVPATVTPYTTTADVLSVVSETIQKNTASPPLSVDTLTSSANTQKVTSTTKIVDNNLVSIGKGSTAPATIMSSTTAADVLSVVAETISNNTPISPSTVDALSSSLTPSTNTKAIMASTKAVVNKQESIGKGSTVPATETPYTTTADVLSVVSETIQKNTASPPSSVDTLSSSANTQDVTATTKIVDNNLVSIGKGSTAPATVMSSTAAADVLSVVSETIPKNTTSSPLSVDASSSSLTSSANTLNVTATSKVFVDKLESIGKETTAPVTVASSTTAADVLPVVAETISKNTPIPPTTIDAVSSSLSSSTNNQEVAASTTAASNKKETVITETTEPAAVVVSTSAAGLLSVVSENVLNNIALPASTIDALSSTLTPSTNAQAETASTKVAISKEESNGKGSTVPTSIRVSTTTADALSIVNETISNNTTSPPSLGNTSSSSFLSSTNKQEVTATTKVAVNKQESIGRETTGLLTVTETKIAADLLPVVSESISNNTTSLPSSVDVSSSSLSSSMNTQEIMESTIAAANKKETVIAETTKPAVVVASTNAADLLSVVSENVLNNIALPASTIDTLITSTNTTEATATKAVINKQENIIKETTESAAVVTPTTTASVFSLVRDVILNNIVAPVSALDIFSSSTLSSDNATEKISITLTNDNNTEFSNASNSNTVFPKIDNILSVTEASRNAVSSGVTQTSIVGEEIVEANKSSSVMKSLEVRKAEEPNVQNQVTESEILKSTLPKTNGNLEISTENTIITKSTAPEVTLANIGGSVPIKVIPVLNVKVPFELGASVVDIAKQ